MFKTFFKWHAYQFCNYNLFAFKDKELQLEFNEWRSVFELKQITFITTLTAFLYYIFTFIHQYIVLPEIVPIMTFWHLYVIPTLLLFVAILAYKKKFCFLMTASLMLATIVAAVANIYIVSKFEGYTTYQTELYLMIFGYLQFLD